MGRRRKVAASAKSSVKVQASKKSPQKKVTDKNISKTEELCLNKDDVLLLPCSSSQDTCIEETVIEPPHSDSIGLGLRSGSRRITHKKFGKVQCHVEADSATSIEPGGSVEAENADTIMMGVTELVWDDDAVVEETVICEDLELEVEDLGSQDDQQEEPDSQCSDFDQERDSVGTHSVTVSEYHSIEVADVPLITSHEEVYISEDIEFSDSPGKDLEVDQIIHNKIFYCESEGTSKDEDSQGSENLTTTDEAEVSSAEIGVNKLRIEENSFLDSSVLISETVVCDTSLPAAKTVDYVDNTPSGHEKEMDRSNDIESSDQLLQNNDKVSTRSCKQTSKSKIPDATTLHVTETVNLSVSSLVVSSTENVELQDCNRSNSPVTQLKNVTAHAVEQVSIMPSSSEVVTAELLLVHNELQMQNSESEENGSVQVSGSQLRKVDEDENDMKQITPTFRNRSGSTDTTGSESSSNCSSGVRRSSRIRSISVQKQRSRTRVEVLSTSNESKNFENRDSSDGNSGTEMQSDKETQSMKVPTPTNVYSSVSSSSNRNLDFKPVKVKSRWRRSSELEMGGNRSSDSDVAVTPPTPMCVSPHLVVPRSSTTSPQFGVVSTPVLPLASQALETTLEEAKEVEEEKEPKKKPPKFEQVVLDDPEMEERLRQFVHLKENEYLTEKSICKEAKRMVCDCFLTKEEVLHGALGCGADCLNRLLLIECGSRCSLGEKCSNKHFQKQEYSTCEVFRTEKKGFGLRAIEDLPAGSFIMEYVGEVLNYKEFRRRAKDYAKDKNRHYYFMSLQGDTIIDATMKGNISRFINHSCDPNSETQKWTVNGEVRIGFFTSRNVAAGEEVTFDYQFQRYGKEAQRCFCESPFCRGWIGDDPEKENEKPERKERKDREVKKKRAEKKQVEEEYLDDIDMEEEIEKLCSTGLKNRAHTVTLCRLMVRIHDTQSRVQLLQFIQQGEPACRRLFLDYHGLKLIASWMPDASTENNCTLQTEILKTLAVLPITNKTVLQDSKVLSFVEKWSLHNADPSSTVITSSSALSSESEVKSEVEEDARNRTSMDEEPDTSSLIEPEQSDEVDGNEDTTMKDVSKEESSVKEPINVDLALALLSEWSGLKEVFRIPKKERIEQMKEHEREADRGYKEYLDKEGTPDKQSYDRWPPRSNDRERKKVKESPESEKVRKSRFDDRGPKMTKEERRQLFAMKVAQEEEEERQRQQHEDLWRSHEEQCLQIGLDPFTTLAFDPETNQRCLFDPVTRSWLPYDYGGNGEEVHSSNFTTSNSAIDQYDPTSTHYDANDLPNAQYDSSNTLNAQYNPNNSLVNSYESVNPVVTHYDPNSPVTAHYECNTSFNANYTLASQFDPVKQEAAYSCVNPPLPPEHAPLPDTSNPPPLPLNPGSTLPISSLIPPIPPHSSDQVEGLPHHPAEHMLDSFAPSTSEVEADNEEEEVFFPMELLALPSKWRSAQDDHGRTYFYHIVVRIPQWHPPWDDCDEQTSESSEESSEEEALEDDDDDGTTSSEEEEEDNEVDFNIKQEIVLHDVKDSKENLLQEELDSTLMKIGKDRQRISVIINKEIAVDSQENKDKVHGLYDKSTESCLINESVSQDENFLVEESDEKDSTDMLIRLREPDESPDSHDLVPDQSEPMDLEDEEEDEEDTQLLEIDIIKRRREGLVQERIISPRRDEDKPEKKNYRELKEKLRRKKEQARKARAKKKRRDSKEKERFGRKVEKLDIPLITDSSSDAARKIKDNFRLQMAGAMVQFLNPYRKLDCKQGRIANTEDFKHLARKLTHFVMLKELKHCKSVDDLDCNDNVKHKARDFIRKYMSKFGPVYQRPEDE